MGTQSISDTRSKETRCGLDEAVAVVPGTGAIELLDAVSLPPGTGHVSVGRCSFGAVVRRAAEAFGP